MSKEEYHDPSIPTNNIHKMKFTLPIRKGKNNRRGISFMGD
jgi:hypothetical protein